MVCGSCRSEERGEKKRIFKDLYFFLSELLVCRQPPLLSDSDGTGAGDLLLLFSGVRGDTPGYCQVRRFQRVRQRLSGGKDSSGSQHIMHSTGEEKRKEK